MQGHYDRVIGYSPLECVNREKMRRTVQVCKKIIDGYFAPTPGDTILVAGSGTGDEAALVYDEFGLPTIGVDLNTTSGNTRHEDFFLLRQDLGVLGIREYSISMVYCYHVLEHVANHLAVLGELFRVLRPGGILFVGFPNKNRIFSYIGTSQRATLADKILWNLNDYSYRLRGRFENRYGAHAGFTEQDFIEDASALFDGVYPVRNEYMLFKYLGHTRIFRLLIASGLAEIVFPSNYYVCVKPNLGAVA